MKKSTIKVLALALVAVMVCVSFIACSKTLSGEYVNEESVMGVGSTKTTYVFDGKKVTLTVSAEAIGMDLGGVSLEGTYKIKGDEITFTFEGEGAAEYSKAVSFEKTDNGIKIAGVEYTKK